MFLWRSCCTFHLAWSRISYSLGPAWPTFSVLPCLDHLIDLITHFIFALEYLGTSPCDSPPPTPRLLFLSHHYQLQFGLWNSLLCSSVCLQREVLPVCLNKKILPRFISEKKGVRIPNEGLIWERRWDLEVVSDLDCWVAGGGHLASEGSWQEDLKAPLVVYMGLLRHLAIGLQSHVAPSIPVQVGAGQNTL